MWFKALLPLVAAASLAAQAPVAPPKPGEPESKSSGMRLDVGLRGAGAWTASKSSTIVDTADSGGHVSVGAAVHFLPIRYVDLGTGVRHRWTGVGYGSSITFQEWQFPLTLAFNLNPGAAAMFFMGGGLTRLLPTSGVIYRTLGGSPNIQVPAGDLKAGVSYFLMAGVQGEAYGSFGYYRFEVGFEYAERPLRIFTRDIFFAFEFGLRAFGG